MIQAQQLSIRRGTKILLQEADFVIHPGERVGITGKNGAGKTSLFAVILGQLDVDAGLLTMPPDWRITHVEQIIGNPNAIAREYVIDGDVHLRDLQQQRAQVSPDDGTKIAELEANLIDANAWSAPARAEQLLMGLGFTVEECNRPVREFSGGWQMRIALAKALMAPADLLLLDEPTNHLDLDAMLWLERWLVNYQGTVLTISHDTEFLDAVARTILNFEDQKLVRYNGNYQSFITQRAERIRQSQIAQQRHQRETERLQGFIDRFKAKASKARQAQSRVKALARMQTLAPLRIESSININLPEPESVPDPLVSLQNAFIGYKSADNTESKIILNGINLTIRGGDRIGVLGVNGAGKSSLIKTIASEINLLQGSITTAKGLNLGYFAQHQLDMLDTESSPLDHMIRIAPQEREQQLRNYLGGFGFSGTAATSKVEPMSGGEKARLALALIVWNKPNLLLLDEPTNHLDVDTRESLTAALAEYGGSMLLVSHDRSLLRTTVDNFWIVHNGQVIEFDGSLEDYHAWLNDHQGGAKQSISDTNPNNADEPDRRTMRRLEAQERQRLAQLKRPIQSKIEKIEQEMHAYTNRLEELDKLLSSADFYSGTNEDERVSVITEHGTLSKSLQALENKWLDLQEQIEAL